MCKLGYGAFLGQRRVVTLGLILIGLLVGNTKAGTYVDCNGQGHPWHVSKTHVLIWDGKPYIPFGGMFVSSWLCSPGEDNFTRDRQALEMIRNAGLDDLYLNTMWKQPAPITQRLIDLFEKLGFRYGIQLLNQDAQASAPGYVIANDEFSVAVHQSGVIRISTAGASTEGARYIVVAADNGRLLQSGAIAAPPRHVSDFAVNVKACPPGGALVKLIPAVTTPQWVAPNADRIVAWLKPLRFGPHLRFFLDPLSNEYSPPRGFLPSDPSWRAAFAVWLQHRYSTCAALAAAWGITTPVLAGFGQASRLVPLVSGSAKSSWPRRGYAVDDKTGAVFTLNMRVCRMWLDMCDFREVFLRRRADHICDQIRRLHDVPIVAKRHYESTRIWISRNAKEGFDGLGMESYGTGDALGRFNGTATYADVVQSKRPLWLLATETSSTYWQNRYIGYKTRTIMYRDINLLLSLGARGFFTFGLKLRASPGDNGWTTFELVNDPRQLQWLALFARAARARTAWLDEIPKTAFWFPVENTDARNFMYAAASPYGLSGAWAGVGAVLGLGPGRWVAPVFYPADLPGAPLILYNRQLMVNPMLAREARTLQSQVPPDCRVKVSLTDPVQLPTLLARRFASPLPPPVNIRVLPIATGVQATTWLDRHDRECLLFQATVPYRRTRLTINRKAPSHVRGGTQPMVCLPGDKKFATVRWPLICNLPGPALLNRQFVLANGGFGVPYAAFSENVGPAPRGLMLRGIPLDDLIIQVTVLLSLEKVTTFRASTGFSGTQGQNGFSYAGVNFKGATNLLAHEVMATYSPKRATWTAHFPGGGSVNITATQQDKTEGNADFSLRFWTAPRAYDSVTITGSLEGTTTETAWIIYYDKATATQIMVSSGSVTDGGLKAGHGTERVPMDATLTGIKAGDRIYFGLQNSGLPGSRDNVMQTWAPTIMAQYH